jgi:uncharacterized membrane protein
MILVLIPLAVWTIVGLIALWPRDVNAHLTPDAATFNVPGVTYPTGRITAIEAMSCEGMAGSTPGVESGTCANVTVTVLDGEGEGDVAEVQLTDAVYASGVTIGQDVKLIRIPPADGQPATYQFSDFERRTPLIIITLIFVATVVAVARWRGFASLIGLGFAAFILVSFMFPALISGSHPVLVGLVGSSAIMFVVLYAAHGFSARTTTALLGTQFGLLLSAGLGWAATRWAHLTGVTAEDDYLLAGAAPDLNLTSVVICGIIVAGLGVLNDVTITQASAVWELADSDPKSAHLFSRAMRIGRDHIASTVYTIAFATAGAVLPVLLLIAIYNRPIFEVLQTEQFASELIRTLVGSIGLVLAVPLTTAIGVAVVRATGTASSRRRSAPEPVAVAVGAAGAAGESDEPAPQRRVHSKPDSDGLDFSDLRDPGDEPPPPRR